MPCIGHVGFKTSTGNLLRPFAFSRRNPCLPTMAAGSNLVQARAISSPKWLANVSLPELLIRATSNRQHPHTCCPQSTSLSLGICLQDVVLRKASITFCAHNQAASSNETDKMDVCLLRLRFVDAWSNMCLAQCSDFLEHVVPCVWVITLRLGPAVNRQLSGSGRTRRFPPTWQNKVVHKLG